MFHSRGCLSHKVGLTAVIYLAGYPAVLQPRCQERQSPGYLRKIWLCFFPSWPSPARWCWDSGPELPILQTHLGDWGRTDWIILQPLPLVWSQRSLILFQHSARCANNEGKRVESWRKRPHICKIKCLCDFYQHILLFRDWESARTFCEKKEKKDWKIERNAWFGQ